MDQLLKFVNNLNTAQRAVIIGGVSLLFIVLVGFLVYSNIKAEDKKLNYTIASNLTKSQVMLASEELEAAGIQHLPHWQMAPGICAGLQPTGQWVRLFLWLSFRGR